MSFLEIINSKFTVSLKKESTLTTPLNADLTRSIVAGIDLKRDMQQRGDEVVN